ncbi:type III-A CRISPR-associated RAMP protein Csm3 [Hornefia butyriciproducens]|uniref:type III-A CRISPR-associated RAMP protein Csm3 n=1 Tax=Hornefia butyriciproducens TaxID=2652293 RepID=UPI002A910358|nr:type III-A CRISPR-associated RAMP protein Csm3 [Hornefia butyriciproducens]MDY5422810.1 type III-A CRISPR-associated RAMP protein Csm3 [Hornefia butyriciproducens]
MLAKIEITGKIILKSGMHIGSSEAFAAIGAIDSPVARDPVSGLPYLPGSSLKGKMRSLLAKAYNENLKIQTRDEDDERIKRLFGCSKNADGNPQSSRLIFSDAILNNMEELKRKGLSVPTEAKEENTINPLTAIANPRMIERVVKGAVFPLSLIYNAIDPDTVEEDLSLLADGLRLLQYDYIGGHGSRGYGRIAIRDLDIACVIGEIDEAVLERCKAVIGAI